MEAGVLQLCDGHNAKCVQQPVTQDDGQVTRVSDILHKQVSHLLLNTQTQTILSISREDFHEGNTCGMTKNDIEIE